jgi:hypothetical protein
MQYVWIGEYRLMFNRKPENKKQTASTIPHCMKIIFSNNDKLVLRDTLSDVESVEPNNTEYYYNYLNFIQRGVQIGNYIYTIGDSNITSYDIETLTLKEKLELYVIQNNYYYID